jgi:hypothetical protein
MLLLRGGIVGVTLYSGKEGERLRRIRKDPNQEEAVPRHVRQSLVCLTVNVTSCFVTIRTTFFSDEILTVRKS